MGANDSSIRKGRVSLVVAYLCCILSHVVGAETLLPIEQISACLIPATHQPSQALRSAWAQCLAWEPCANDTLCEGSYLTPHITPLHNPQELRLEARQVVLQPTGRSALRGEVVLRQADQQLEANTAYVVRDPQTKTITQIVLADGLRWFSPEGMMVAQKGLYIPTAQTLRLEQALYYLRTKQRAAQVGGWGRARSIFKNEAAQLFLKQATFSYCPPADKSWELRTQRLTLDRASNVGVARDATLVVRDIPVLYTPYLSFPLSKKRKSGVLMPLIGSTTVGGIDIATPYYLNLAPNYDATFIPHVYTKRGLMYGGNFRYLTPQSVGTFRGNILPQDRAFGRFLIQNADQIPSWARKSSDRWDIQWLDTRQLGMKNLTLAIDARQLSDNYYLQDFSTNLARVTERQILRQGVLEYSTDHWVWDAVLQSYQTLHPLNETPVANAYERLPQLSGIGEYDELPLNMQLQLGGGFDYFRWPTSYTYNPDGLRYRANPRLSADWRQPWGYVDPMVQWVGNAYTFPRQIASFDKQSNINVPRFSVDSGLIFERSTTASTTLLTPRLYYLNVPYQNQSQIPAFESGYMIFTAQQVFRDNRFSGFDRIGDANQLGYGAELRWLNASGEEKASFLVGQLSYFANRKVFLCYDPSGVCTQDPLTLGFLSPTAKQSPVANHGVYHLTPAWSLVGDYAWDPATQATNNAQASIQFQTAGNRLLNVGYSYLVNGDVTQVGTLPLQDKALNQISASYAWPFNDRWSSLGAYSYNISKQYQMMTFFGLQYDSCCWAMRLMGGRTFRSLNQWALPEYTNSVFVQVLLKGLGSVGTNDPTSVLRTFLPDYVDPFKK